ncbi:uncharacterized protein EV420DRAFT_1711647 [Desarmillaria tabescens]|uniref:DUF6534 domain-containing protein n=1 Tax=Armillaria tabescens TaxID=1929756 RepID=A0AA39JTB5_ARMTA|nr:uncharacterized protein EV420DRAFT_1711647 [Desarmillaria tabescens]KAK0448409.1 hypothetical protein EV420DRAFT_1711647 [Desarmillaria tabescens]
MSISIIKRSIYTFFSVIAATDFIIALMMCYYLHKVREDTQFSSTSAVTVTLIACSLLALIAYIVWPKSLIFLGIDFALPKFYVNSLLAMLNYWPKCPSTQFVAERSKHSIPTIVRITLHTSEGDTQETSFLQDIGIPLSEIWVSHSFNHKSAHSDPGGPLNYEVQE